MILIPYPIYLRSVEKRSQPESQSSEPSGVIG